MRGRTLTILVPSNRIWEPLPEVIICKKPEVEVEEKRYLLPVTRSGTPESRIQCPREDD